MQEHSFVVMAHAGYLDKCFAAIHNCGVIGASLCCAKARAAQGKLISYFAGRYD
jgi:hypothetical protein